MYDIFISYSHSHTGGKAEHLLTILENQGFANRVSLDKHNLVGRFDVEILRRIDNCKDFIIIVGEQTFRNVDPTHSPYYNRLANCSIDEFYTLVDTLPFTLDYLRLELARAIAKNKNIIPIAPAKSSKYNFDDLGGTLPEDIKLLVKHQGVFYDDRGSFTFQDVVETKVIGNNSNTLLLSVPHYKESGFKWWKGLLAVLPVVIFVAIGVIFFRERQAFEKCRTIGDYESFITAKPLFYGGKAESNKLQLEKLLEFGSVKSGILTRVVDFGSLRKISYIQAQALLSILENMVYVEGGSFLMGSDDASVKEAPEHSAQVDNFYIGRYECSVAEWLGILDKTCDGYNIDSLSAPVVNISWEEAMAYVAKLNEILPGLEFSLPHEKEWEYAAGGGQLSAGYEYAGSNDPTEVAWTLADSLVVPQVRPSDGIMWWRESNELGIFNMSGNVAEFCENKFYYYSSPQKEFKFDLKVIRGGSFMQDSSNCKIYSRDLISTEAVSKGIGFRLVSRIK